MVVDVQMGQSSKPINITEPPADNIIQGLLFHFTITKVYYLVNEKEAQRSSANCNDESKSAAPLGQGYNEPTPTTPIDAVAPVLPSTNERIHTREGRKIHADQFQYLKTMQKIRDMELNCETPTSHNIRERHFIFSGGGMDQPPKQCNINTQNFYFFY